MKKYERIFTGITMIIFLFIVLYSCAAYEGKQFNWFRFASDDNTSLSADVEGVIDQNNHTVSLAVSYLVDLTELVASFSISGDSTSVNGVTQTPGVTTNDFSAPIQYTVHSATGSNTSYTVTASPENMAMREYLKAPNNVNNLAFGQTLAMTDDLIVVGTPSEDSTTDTIIHGSDLSETNTTGNTNGAVYVFAKVDGVWEHQAYLKPPNNSLLDEFGNVVAISGDTIVVGVDREDSTTDTIIHDPDLSETNDLGNSNGAVYVFHREYNIWSLQAYLKAPGNDIQDYFGGAVAIDGDTIVVGAIGEDSNTNTIINGDSLSGANDNGSSNGAAYVYHRDNGVWSLQAYLKAPNTTDTDVFGASVDIDGDTIVVGAYQEDSTTDAIISGTDLSSTNDLGFQNGAAYVFVRDGATWSHQAYLKPSETTNNDRFGNSVAIYGDTIVVGADGEDSTTDAIINGTDLTSVNDSGNWIGAAYVFFRNGTTWTQQAYLKAPNLPDDSYFGQKAEIYGDRILIGAYAEKSQTDTIIYGEDLSAVNTNGTDNGAVFLFKRVNGSWTRDAYLKAPNNDDSDQFGYAVAIYSDMMVVSSPLESGSTTSIIHGSDLSGADNAGMTNGAVYLFK